MTDDKYEALQQIGKSAHEAIGLAMPFKPHAAFSTTR
jgi:hypothetical protein